MAFEFGLSLFVFICLLLLHSLIVFSSPFVTRAVFRAWNSSSIQLINYFGLEGLVDLLNLQEKVGLLMPKGIGTYLRYLSSLVA